MSSDVTDFPSFVSEKTLPNEGSDTPERGCSADEGATGIGLRAEQGLLSTNTGAWPSNTAVPALETEDEIDGDWGRDSLVMRLLTSESGLADLGICGIGEQRFLLPTELVLPDKLVGLFLFLGLGLLPLGRGIILRGISGMISAVTSSAEGAYCLCSGLRVDVGMEELTSLETESG